MIQETRRRRRMIRTLCSFVRSESDQNCKKGRRRREDTRREEKELDTEDTFWEKDGVIWCDASDPSSVGGVISSEPKRLLSLVGMEWILTVKL